MNNDNLGNFLDALGVMLALVNIDLNDKQIEQLNEHLQQQDEAYLKKAINQNQNLIDRLEYSIKQNDILIGKIEELIDVLKNK